MPTMQKFLHVRVSDSLKKFFDEAPERHPDVKNTKQYLMKLAIADGYVTTPQDF